LKAISLNYARLWQTRAEYGYRGEFANLSATMPLDQDGLWHVDLQTGESELIVTIEELRLSHPRRTMQAAEHYVNHAMYSPDGRRLVFLHRWFGKAGQFSRLYVCDSDGANLKLLRDERMASHFTWRDNEHLLAWAR